jgi:hypothetical protein
MEKFDNTNVEEYETAADEVKEGDTNDQASKE